MTRHSRLVNILVESASNNGASDCRWTTYSIVGPPDVTTGINEAVDRGPKVNEQVEDAALEAAAGQPGNETYHASRTGILPRDAARCLPLIEEPCLINDSNCIVCGEVLDNIQNSDVAICTFAGTNPILPNNRLVSWLRHNHKRGANRWQRSFWSRARTMAHGASRRSCRCCRRRAIA